ncbi:hypothetical protein CANCADRAFT_25699 [Tortispora caseinolytica NRRL Y-17796]|uniref:ESCRT-II complex subunit VPS25 n=1 Tax=Tortispora caseinolytica NRRL Y-17796 TaxID=767744 RepID=A0A1E4TGR1_9ASCO|nr:hypothetical protein CANCADRAFT_25699 [Tortispora caseinolytica NRRL Y-17796]
MSYQYPKAYSYPPFFTKQPNPQTWQSQLQLWKDFIIDWSKFHRAYRLNPTSDIDLFHNQTIDRRLSPQVIDEILKYMTDNGSGEFDSKEFVIYWKSPEEWAESLYKWIESTGQISRVLTFKELKNAPDFNDIDQFVLRKAIQVLSKRGKAQIMKVDNVEAGVKFF